MPQSAGEQYQHHEADFQLTDDFVQWLEQLGDGGPRITFYHGTDLRSAGNICSNGIDARHGAQYNGSGDFWATTSLTDARIFAAVNPAGGVPAILRFELSGAILIRLLSDEPISAYYDTLGAAFCFLPASLATVNQHMTNLELMP